MIWQTTGTRGIRVHHDSDMDGGGTWFGTEFAEILTSRYTRSFSRCLEWCSGPGFIGFDLLDHNVCQELVFLDRHAPAIECSIPATIRDNGLSGIQAYLGHNLASLPEQEKFDLVVANPPHYLECPGDANYQRLAVDPGWIAHQDFLLHIGQYLESDGMILLQENQAGSLRREAEWQAMFKAGRLEIRRVFDSPRWYNQPGPWCQIYYIELVLAK